VVILVLKARKALKASRVSLERLVRRVSGVLTAQMVLKVRLVLKGKTV
jgi:hypothetical protein